MRIIAEIPHPQFKITILTVNSKYLIKIELSSFEQIYKIREEDVSSLDDLKRAINEEFLEEVFRHFIAMRASFSKSLQGL